MPYLFIIFCILVFIVEMAVIYSPLYFVSYSILHIDRKIGDDKLFTLLLISSITISIILLPTVLRVLAHIIVK